MVTIYWFALIVGGGLLAASLFGDLFGADIDDPDAGDNQATRILSLRNLTYFLFAFGATGIALKSIAPAAETTTAAIAAAVGLIAAGAAAVLLNYVQRTESGGRTAEDSFVGCMGRLTLPFAEDRAGRVMIQRDDREFELRARPFDAAATMARIGTSIIVVEMDGGTALVAPVEESLPAAGLDT